MQNLRHTESETKKDGGWGGGINLCFNKPLRKWPCWGVRTTGLGRAQEPVILKRPTGVPAGQPRWGTHGLNTSTGLGSRHLSLNRSFQALWLSNPPWETQCHSLAWVWELLHYVENNKFGVGVFSHFNNEFDQLWSPCNYLLKQLSMKCPTLIISPSNESTFFQKEKSQLTVTLWPNTAIFLIQ